jgi:hypothetical protein
MRACRAFSGAMPRPARARPAAPERQDHELGQDHALDDLGGQARALAQRLGHLHQRPGRHAGIGRRAAGVLDEDPNVGHAHRGVVDEVVAKAHLAGGTGVQVDRHRDRTVAAEKLAAQAEHLEVDLVGLVGAQQLGGARRQAELRRHRPRRATLHADLLREDTRRLAELAVEGLVGDVLHQPGQRHALGPQQQQRREHPSISPKRSVVPLRGHGPQDSPK